MTDTPTKTFKPEDVLAMMRDTDKAFRERGFAPKAKNSAGPEAGVLPFTPRSVVSDQAPLPEAVATPEPMSQAGQDEDAVTDVAPQFGATEHGAEHETEVPAASLDAGDEASAVGAAQDFTPAPQPPSIDIEAERQVAWDAGHAAAMANLDQAVAAARDAALAEARATAEAELGQAREAFLSGVAALTHAEAELIAGIGGAIETSVRQIASDRAGQAISDLPLPFIQRVEGLAAQVATGLSKTQVYMNAEDLAAIRPHVGDTPTLADARLIPDAGLQRGDLRLKAGEITLSDVIVDPQNGAAS